jgi:hypothetical protein
MCYIFDIRITHFEDRVGWCFASDVDEPRVYLNTNPQKLQFYRFWELNGFHRPYCGFKVNSHFVYIIRNIPNIPLTTDKAMTVTMELHGFNFH